MALARLDGATIVDWDTLHTACARELGFPEFYGRNGNAWIDCLSYIDDDAGMSRFVLGPSEVLCIEVIDSGVLRKQAPAILHTLSQGTASVNARSFERDGRSRLELVLL